MPESVNVVPEDSGYWCVSQTGITGAIFSRFPIPSLSIHPTPLRSVSPLTAAWQSTLPLCRPLIDLHYTTVLYG